MKRLREWWRDIVGFLKWRIEQSDPIYKEIEKCSEMLEKNERLQKHYPNILARLKEAAERKDKK